MRIVHVITGLTAGGAEEMLYSLLSNEGGATRAVRVVSLVNVGPIGERIRDLGIPVDGLGLREGVPHPGALVRLIRLLRSDRPDLVQTWMYHADLLGGLAARLMGIPVVWGIHHQWSPNDKRLTRLTRKTCAVLSPFLPTRVVFVSESSLEAHAAAGYSRRKLVHIPNGFDLGRFKPDPVARAEVRRELGLPEGVPLVGHAARYHPDKGHATLIAAAAMVSRTLSSSRFVLCGDGVTWENAELVGQLKEAGLVSAVHLLGQRTDVERVFAAVDVACLSSRTESFPLAAAEAMACGVPCVSTDCGDVRAILGGTGSVVPVGDAPALAQALLAQLGLPPDVRQAMSDKGRRHVARAYGIDAVVARYIQIQDEAVAASGEQVRA
jgi:glycosyltransferase involved in cell wall biosynthesis